MPGARCSWKLDSSTASTSYGSATASATGTPTLPTASARRPAARSIEVSIRTAVVLPLVPVSASHGAAPSGRSRQASSTSPITSIPASAAAASSGWCGGQPVAMTWVVPSGIPAGSPKRTSTPASASSAATAR